MEGTFLSSFVGDRTATVAGFSDTSSRESELLETDTDGDTATLRFGWTVETDARPSGGVPGASTCQWNRYAAVSPSPSRAVSAAVPEQVASGVPDTTRAGDTITPSGRPKAP